MHFIGCLNTCFRYIASILLSITLLASSLLDAEAAALSYMPEAGHMLTRTNDYNAINLLGLELNPKNPFELKFIVDQGDTKLSDKAYELELNRLVSYFLSALTVAQEALWVNLSPNEQNRIMDYDLSQTDLGRDMLGQDYILKQLSASLTHPENELGKDYWKHQLGTTPRLDSNDLSKIWIKPSKAELFVDASKVLIGTSSLKLATENLNVSSNMISEIEDEVNRGEHFARLRQIYNATLLAHWFKKSVVNSLFDRYIGSNKIEGINVDDTSIREKVFQQYLSAFEIGAYDTTIKARNSDTGRLEKRRYICGGIDLDVSSAIEYLPYEDKSLSDEEKRELYIKLIEETKEKFEVSNDLKDTVIKQFGTQFDKMPDITEHIMPEKLDISSFESEPVLSGSTAKVYRELEGVYKVMRHDTQFNDKVINEISILHKLSQTKLISEINNLEAIGLTQQNVPYLRLSSIVNSRPLDLKHSNLSESDKLILVRDIASVYKELIDSGVIHGDIKKDNVLINDGGDFLIIDFGMSKDIDDPKYSEKYDESPAYYVQQDVKDFAHMIKDIFFDWQGNSLIIEDKAMASSFYDLLERMWFSRAEDKIMTFEKALEELEAFISSSSLRKDLKYGGVDLSEVVDAMTLMGEFTYSDEWSEYTLDSDFTGFSFEILSFTK